MAIPAVSIMVTRRQRQTERLEQLLVVHQEEVAQALDQFLRQVGSIELGDAVGDETDVQSVLKKFRTRLTGTLNELLEAERLLLDELANDLEPRQNRDQAASSLLGDLFHLRDLFRGAYGKPAAEKIGFEKRIAREPLPLWRQGERILGRLRDPEFQLPEPRFAGIEIAVEAAARAIEHPLARLREGIDAVNLERSREHGRRIAKVLAMKRFDGAFRPIVRILKSAFRLAGYDELAARVPTSLRR